MAHLENQFRVVLEFLRSSGSHGRIIRLNHSPTVLPPQLAGRLHPGFWQAFVEDAGQLSLRHPYSAKPKAKDYCTWAACFGLGALVGLFCINPDAGDYGAWEADARRLCDRWAPGLAQAGCALTLQRHRDYFLQIDINPNVPLPPQPVAPPMPTQPAPVGAVPGQVQPQPQAGQLPQLPPAKQ